MSNEALKQMIVRKLAAGIPPRDIVFELCEKYNAPWAEAEKLVHSMQHAHGDEVTKRQAPLIGTLSITIFLGGVGLFFYCVYAITIYIDLLTQENTNALLMAEVIFRIVRYAPGQLAGLVTGLAMTAGGALGMKPIWEMLLPKK